MVKKILKDARLYIYSLIGNDKRDIVFLLSLFLFALGITVVGILSEVWPYSVKEVITTIEAKQYIPAYVSESSAGKFGMQKNYHKELSKIYFKANGESVVFIVEKDFFDSVNVGDKIEVTYFVGKFKDPHEPMKVVLADK